MTALARGLAEQIARGEAVREDQALALSGAVLNSRVVGLAAAVMAAPPEFRATRVLDLVEVLTGRKERETDELLVVAGADGEKPA